MPFSALEISATALSSRSVGVSSSGADLPRLSWVTLLALSLVGVPRMGRRAALRRLRVSGEPGSLRAMKKGQDSHKTYYGIFRYASIRLQANDFPEAALASPFRPSMLGSEPIRTTSMKLTLALAFILAATTAQAAPLGMPLGVAVPFVVRAVHGCHRGYSHDIRGWHRHGKSCEAQRGLTRKRDRQRAI